MDIQPRKARDIEGWIPNAHVEYHFGSGVTIIPLYSKKILFDKNNAIKYSICMAKKWVDGNY